MCEHYFSPPHKSMRESTRDSPGPQRDIELRRGQLEWHRISFKGQQTGRPPNPNVKTTRSTRVTRFPLAGTDE